MKSFITMLVVAVVCGTIVLAYFLFRPKQTTIDNPQALNTSKMQITSPSFKNNETLPAKFTCDGEGVSPAFNFSEIPDETQSLVFIVDDPDASEGIYTHWLVWNISPSTTQIKESQAPTNAIEGTNSDNQTNYVAACPPSGTHRYFFRIFALDQKLDLDKSATRTNLEEAMQDHILAEAEMIGKSSR